MNNLTSSGVAFRSSCMRMASLRQLQISGIPRQPSLFWSYLSNTTLTVLRIYSSLLIIQQIISFQMEETFIIAIGNERLQAPKRLAEASEYISNILFIGQGEEEIEIDPNIVSSSTFQQVLRFYEINDYIDPEVVQPIRTNNLQDILDKKNYEFIKDFSPLNENTYKLLNAAQFLVCNGLKKVLAALVACKLYFQDDKASYEKKKAELGITQEMSFEDEERYKQAFVFDNGSKSQ